MAAARSSSHDAEVRFCSPLAGPGGFNGHSAAAVDGGVAATPAVRGTGNMAEDAPHEDDAASRASSPPTASEGSSGANTAPATQAAAGRSYFLRHVTNYQSVLVAEKGKSKEWFFFIFLKIKQLAVVMRLRRQ
jgi:hypothetical protein